MDPLLSKHQKELIRDAIDLVSGRPWLIHNRLSYGSSSRVNLPLVSTGVQNRQLVVSKSSHHLNAEPSVGNSARNHEGGLRLIELRSFTSRNPETPSDSMETHTGTGAAVPVVSGLAALLVGKARSRGHELSAIELVQLLKAASIDQAAAMNGLDKLLSEKGR